VALKVAFIFMELCRASGKKKIAEFIAKKIFFVATAQSIKLIKNVALLVVQACYFSSVNFFNSPKIHYTPTFDGMTQILCD